MNSLKIERQNGNVPKSLPGEDHVSGFLVYMTEAVPEAFRENIHAISTLEAAEKLGITADTESWELQAIHYQLSEIFRINPSISLYVSLASSDSNGYTELLRMQRFAGGRIRQAAVWRIEGTISKEDVTALQGVADALDEENAPLSVLYGAQAPIVENPYADMRGPNQSRVSVVIAQDCGGKAAELYGPSGIALPALGVVLGLLSKAAVHQSISWVKNFPTGVSVPGFLGHVEYCSLDRAIIEQYDAAGCLFFMPHVGLSGSYLNGSHTMDSPTSDYSTIESVRTMDKAVRGIRTYLIPELGGNVYVDAETGKLQAYSVSHLETVAGKALEDMEKAGELSGYVVEIDPEQDVLSTGCVEIVVRQVAVGVMRNIKVKIGFAKSV